MPNPWDTEDDKDRKAKGPPCQKCKPPLMMENITPVELYCRCQDQLIFAGMGEVVAIKHEAIDCAMRWMQICDNEKLDLADNARRISSMVLDLQRKDHDDKHPKGKK